MAHIANVRIHSTATSIFLKVDLYDDKTSDEFFLAGTKHVFCIDRDNGAVTGRNITDERENAAIAQCMKSKSVRGMVRNLIQKGGAA